MIEAFHSLAEAARSERVQDFVPVSQMVFHNSLIVSLVIIIAVIMDVHELEPFDLPLAWHLERPFFHDAGSSLADRPRQIRINTITNHLNNMSLDLLVTILSHIINLSIIPRNLLFLMIIQMFSQVLQRIRRTDWIYKHRLIRVFVGTSRGEYRLGSKLLAREGRGWALWIRCALKDFTLR